MSNTDTSCKAIHLTHVLRRRPDLWNGRMRAVCDMMRYASPFVGELPPELRVRVPREQIGETFHAFARAMDDFVRANTEYLVFPSMCRSYNMTKIGAMFDLDCVLISHNPKWLGAFSAVSHLVFERGSYSCEYALKVYYDNNYACYHGPLSEIPTALAAYRAEPRDNEKTHMASLAEQGAWTLCDWVDEFEPVTRSYTDNRYKIFDTTYQEIRPDNFLRGPRSDFGDTWMTKYAYLSYRGRKLYRCLCDMIENQDISAFYALDAKCSTVSDRRDWESAMRLHDYAAARFSLNRVRRAINRRLR